MPKVNNKLSRKRAEKKLNFTKLEDGTEVLHSKESRQKLRRWTFEADVTMRLPQGKNEDGTEKEPIVLPTRRVKLEGISYGTAKDARVDVAQQERTLRATSQMLQTADIKVYAMPHETVSKQTMDQITGYRDMAMILDKALAMSIQEAQEVVAGRSVGSKFAESDAVPASEGVEAKPARTLATIKEGFYKEALKELTAREEENVSGDGNRDSQAESAIEITDAEEGERKEFVPEIVEIQRAAQ